MHQPQLAKDLGIQLSSVNDALDLIGNGFRLCVFTLDDVSEDFFDLSNGIAGDVFQKFINYNCKTAFVVPPDHGLGDRVSELVREYRTHPTVRLFESEEAALRWQAGNQ